MFRPIGEVESGLFDIANGVVFDPNQLQNRVGAPGSLEVKAIPTAFALNQNFPNPFNPQTIIEFDLPSDGSVQIDVYNLLGQRVRRLVEAPHGAGRHSVAWDARDDQGHRVAAGVYLYRLTANSGVRVRKMLLLK